MAATGAWARSVLGDQPYASPLKQGTGWNPIHAVRGGDGRNIAPDGTGTLIEQDLVSENIDTYDSYGYTSEDAFMFNNIEYDESNSLNALGFLDRPDLGGSHNAQARAAMPEDYPSWGNVNSLNGSKQEIPLGIPGGTVIRSIEIGAQASTTANVLPDEDVAQGWQNKAHGADADSVDSDPSQIFMQTSEVQRYKTRTGSQISGTASEYDAPIPSRVVGQKLKFWSGGERHYDMAPKGQDVVLRPWNYRTAGTGNPANMHPNEMYVSTALQRTPPSDPDQGDVLPISETPDGSSSYGFTTEDQVW